MELRDRIKNYFKLTPEQKDEILVEIVKIYIRVNEERFDNTVHLIDLIDRDIRIFEDDEQFEAAQALTDIRHSITMLEEEIINNIKNGLQNN